MIPHWDLSLSDLETKKMVVRELSTNLYLLFMLSDSALYYNSHVGCFSICLILSMSSNPVVSGLFCCRWLDLKIKHVP